MTLIVNGEKIEDSVIQAEYERLKPHYEQTFTGQSTEQQKAQLTQWSKENVTERILIQQQARKFDCEINPEEIETALNEAKKQFANSHRPDEAVDALDNQKLKKEIVLKIKVEHLLEDVCRDLPEPSDKNIRKFYNKNKDNFRTPERIRASHIVKHINWQTDEKTAQTTIEKANQELQNGGVFEMLVQKYSDCPQNNGDLGYFTRGQMVEEFDDVLFNLNKGQTSDVFRTRFGFHIAKLYDREPAKTLPIKQAGEKIIPTLKAENKTKAIENYVDELKNKAQIKEA